MALLRSTFAAAKYEAAKATATAAKNVAQTAKNDVVKADGTLQDAMDIVEYSNHEGGTYWSDLRRKNVLVRFTSSEVAVLDMYMKEVVVHRRLYGEENRTSSKTAAGTG